MTPAPLGWVGIVRLGLVQTALGAIVVLTTSAINRVMIVELALPALIPGLLVAIHHAVQMLRPRWGHGSDAGGRLAPWIAGGMGILALGGIGAAVAVSWMTANLPLGIALAVGSFALVGIGSGAAGTCLLVLLAKRVTPERRGAAATIVWLMMIAGFAITSGVVGHLLDPFSPARLVSVAIWVSTAAVIVTIAALAGLEGAPDIDSRPALLPSRPPFWRSLMDVWGDPLARQLTVFIFISMLAYFSEELVLDPFSGFVFDFTPGQSTRLSSTLHSGVFTGMIALAAITATPAVRTRLPVVLAMRAGCLASAAALIGLVACAVCGPPMPLKAMVFALGCGNGIFAVAAIATMMGLAGRGRAGSEGVRMGVWGAAQGIAAGVGGVAGAGASDLARHVFTAPGTAYAVVFAMQATLFVIAAKLAPRAAPVPNLLQSRPIGLQPAE